MRIRSLRCRVEATGNLGLSGRLPGAVNWAHRLRLAAVFGVWPLTVFSQLEVVPQGEPQCFFSGEARKVVVTVRNPGREPLEADLRIRLYQASSATTVLVQEAPWKRLPVLGGQAVIESAVLTLPLVTAETRFLVQWTDGKTNAIGRTELLVYPPGLLRDLKPMLGEQPLGVFDPQNQLRLPLKDAGIEVVDLEDSGLGDFSGKLAIIGPFPAKTPMPEGLAKQIKSLAAKGVAVVCLQPLRPRRERIMPSFYGMHEGKGIVVAVEPSLVCDLPQNPTAQLNLIRFAGLATHPEASRLPFLLSDQ
jgi:hypothetical protein